MNITNAYYLVPRDDDGNIVSGADAIGIKATVDGTPCQIPQIVIIPYMQKFKNKLRQEL